MSLSVQLDGQLSKASYQEAQLTVDHGKHYSRSKIFHHRPLKAEERGGEPLTTCHE